MVLFPFIFIDITALWSGNQCPIIRLFNRCRAALIVFGLTFSATSAFYSGCDATITMQHLLIGTFRFLANIIDIAPDHAGYLMGISNTVAAASGIIGNIFVGLSFVCAGLIITAVQVCPSPSARRGPLCLAPRSRATSSDGACSWPGRRAQCSSGSALFVVLYSLNDMKLRNLLDCSVDTNTSSTRFQVWN
jgi:hypothetical protein